MAVVRSDSRVLSHIQDGLAPAQRPSAKFSSAGTQALEKLFLAYLNVGIDFSFLFFSFLHPGFFIKSLNSVEFAMKNK